MADVEPRLPEVLSRAQVNAMHQTALRLLDEVGLHVEDQRLAARLAAEAGVTYRDERLHLAPWLVETHLAAYRADLASAEQQREPGSSSRRIHLYAGCCAHHIVDLDTDAVRPITTADLIQATKLISALHDQAVGGTIPGFPQDVPPPLQALAEYVISSKYARQGGSFTAPCSLQGLDYVYEMHQVTGQSFGLPLYVISPLRLVGDSLEAILRYADRLQHVGASSMPVMGANAPIHFAGAFSQAMAESLGGFVVLRLLLPQVPAGFGAMAFCLDMHYGSITYGSPEQNLMDLIGRAVRSFYGLPASSTRSVRTMAKRPGVQAAAEKAASAACGALAGSRSFMGGGTLSVDEVFSAEQLVLDREITDYAGRLAQGFDFSEETLSFDIVRECAASGDFLAHPSTLHAFRQVYWLPRLFEHPMLEAWRATGERDVRERAREMMRAALARCDYELPPAPARALDEIYDHACAALARDGPARTPEYSQV
jgi:trimethylamine---corrinoid protein Co-methyltransferase